MYQPPLSASSINTPKQKAEPTMSMDAMTWVLEDAPNVKPHLVAVLLGLASHADPDGNGACPTLEELAHYSRKTLRMVQNDLRQLE